MNVLRWVLSILDLVLGALLVFLGVLFFALNLGHLIEAARSSSPFSEALLKATGPSLFIAIGAATVWSAFAIRRVRRHWVWMVQGVVFALAILVLGVVGYLFFIGPQSIGPWTVIFGLLGIFALVILALSLVTEIVGYLMSSVALRSARNSMRDPLAAGRLRTEGPTETMIHNALDSGVSVRLFRSALLGYRIETVGSMTCWTLLLLGFVSIPVAFVWLASKIGWLALVYALWMTAAMAYVIVRASWEISRLWCISRRLLLFPQSLEYGYRVHGAYMNWADIPPPYPDSLADRLQDFAVRLGRIEDRLLLPTEVIAILTIILALLVRAGSVRLP